MILEIVTFDSAARYNGRPVFEGKPIIGIAGGIGSGKTFVAKQFGEEGCLVINSDEMVRQGLPR